MAETPEGLILTYLRRLDEKVDRVLGDVQDFKHRMTSLEGQMAAVRTDMVTMSGRIDRIEGRLDHIERRLDLLPTA